MGCTLQAGDRISRYLIVGPLGSGGMGEVYAAEDESLRRRIALKILPPGIVRDGESLRRFVAEARTASSLNHPNIITIHEIGQGTVDRAGADVVHFIAMELVSGETLARKIHHGGADLPTLLSWLAQAAEGLAKAHASGIVHRDLKPGNIMVTEDGLVKVLDFGLAKLSERKRPPGEDPTNEPTKTAPVTREGTILGTVGYMSPEQVLGRTVDLRSDVFSMGCILYEAATRRRPFAADTDVEAMQKILREPPPPIDERNPEVPAAVIRLIGRCLEKSPDRRLQSMKDLAIELREAAEGNAAPRPRRGYRRSLLAAAVLTGLAVVVYVVLGGRVARTPAGPTPEEMILSVLMSRTDLGDAVLSSDGRYLAYSTETGDRRSLDVLQVHTGSKVSILPPQEFPIRGISFSPDGDYLYYLNPKPGVSRYFVLFRVPSLGGNPTEVLSDVDSRVAFSPDGKRLCFMRHLPGPNADGLFVLELEAGGERELARVDAPRTLADQRGNVAMGWSPDNHVLAAAQRDPEGGMHSAVVTLDAATGERKIVGEPRYWLFINSLGWLPDASAVIVSGTKIGTVVDQIYSLSYPGGEIRRLTNDLSGYSNVSLSADGETIAAVRASAERGLWIVSAGGASEPRPLTSASGVSTDVQLILPVADGGILFTAAQGNRLRLWRMQVDGSDWRRFGPESLLVFDVDSAPGTGIVFAQVDESAQPHIWRVDPDGGGLKQITHGPGELLADLAPDGKTMAFVRADDPSKLWVLDLEQDTSTVLTTGFSLLHARFSPDSQNVLYSALEPREGIHLERHLVMPVRGGDPRTIPGLPAVASDVRWAPDGRGVTYIDRSEGGRLVLQALEDGPGVPLFHLADGRVLDHRWAPDGRTIAVHGKRGQRHGLWILRPGADPVLVAELTAGEIFEYEWTPDSTSLVFTQGISKKDVVLLTR